MRRSTPSPDQGPQENRFLVSENPQLKRVISLSVSFELLWSREAVLHGAGFEVFSTLSSRKALAKIRAGQYGVLLVCYSLPRSVQEEVARQFRESCPGGQLIAITDKKPSQPSIAADRVVYGADGAEALIAAIRARATGRAA